MVDDPSQTQSNPDDIQNRLEAIFFPEKMKRTTALKDKGGLFVHYTSAEVAESILTKHEIWMRDTRVMNDYKEIDHGYQCLRKCYNNCGLRDRLRGIFVNSFPGVVEEAETRFNLWFNSIRNATYIFCASEHDPLKEHNHGRLSMWRAYGTQNPVALVFRGDVMFSQTDVLNAYAMPVNYLSGEELQKYLEQLADSIEANIGFLQKLERDEIERVLFNLFHFSVVCTKHPGFGEELEWRVIASVEMYDNEHLPQNIQSVRGVLQKIVKLKLKDMTTEGLPGLALPDLLERVIVGPCKHPDVIADSLCELMINAGIPDASSRIVISDIPLRPN